MRPHPAIPTEYKGYQFRSRLEARWAAFFDAVGWPWDYEPIDLGGYIPDFVLKFYKPLLVEVKPEMTLGDLYKYTARIDATDWKYNALVLGATLLHDHDEGCFHAIGILRQGGGDPKDPEDTAWSPAQIHCCTKCKRLSIHHAAWGWVCEVSGCYEGDHFLTEAPVDALTRIWGEAHKVTAWHQKERR